ncbi:MAG: exodeoxyribonuclease VII large subunit, partial [Deltaproteobacteria bacterium]|nr:exodeoxyribonuclease VII large subunit [Deltaproteobacteria bacterium]
YFQLKDSQAILKAIVWRYNAQRSGGAALQNGLSVVARGRLSVYGPRGEYQLIVDRLAPKGEGSLSLAFERLKKALEAEGLFGEARKRPLPAAPGRVALLASPGSAAASDFLSASVRRCRGAWISLFPVRVQGKGAAEEIAGALETLNSWGGFDLAVITRGGGSMEDLWAFNEETIVRAVAGSRLPVLAAIGHSTDLSLVELAADARAITPTAAAEAVFPRDSERLERLGAALGRLRDSARGVWLDKSGQLQKGIGQLGRLRYRLGRFAQLLDGQLLKLESAVKKRLAFSRNMLDSLSRSLDRASPVRTQALRRQRLEALGQALAIQAQRLVDQRKTQLEWLVVSLDLVSPLAVLTRGYSVVTGPDGRVVRSADQVRADDRLDVRLARGHLKAVVSQVVGPEPDLSSGQKVKA